MLTDHDAADCTALTIHHQVIAINNGVMASIISVKQSSYCLHDEINEVIAAATPAGDGRSG
jgi:hypothetical protein